MITYMYACVSAYVHVCMCECIYMYMYMYACVSAYVYVCMCECICTCMRAFHCLQTYALLYYWNILRVIYFLSFCDIEFVILEILCVFNFMIVSLLVAFWVLKHVMRS